MTPGRARELSLAFSLGVLSACGSSDDEGTRGGGQGGTENTGGSVGAGGTTESGGSLGSGGGASGGGGPSGLEQVCAEVQGTRLARGPCFKSCTFNGTLEPLYDQNGDCGRLGYKCGTTQYCTPNLRCSADAACQAVGGPGWSCITTVGPYVGQCLLSCTGDGDCPPSGGSTPYLCKPVDAVGVCRF